MKSLEHVPLGKRIMLTFIIVVIILFALAAFGYYSGGWDKAEGAQAPPISEAEKAGRLKHTCITDEDARERVRQIMITALDDGLHDYLVKLFTTWMADDRGQPERARIGVSQAFRAHQIAKQLAYEWNPPLCK